MDTKAADIYLNRFFDDSRFLDRDNCYDAMPEMSKDFDDNFCMTFLKKYISFCQGITSERRDKIRLILSSKGYNIENCQNTIFARIESMIADCDKLLLPEDKEILEWKTRKKETDDYASVPNRETIKKWLAETDFRNPNRLYLYKIAFALKLVAYFPHEIEENDNRYKNSMNFLFNKVYNQRYVTRTADELIFVFCLKNSEDYLTAMRMLAEYKRKCKNTDSYDEVNIHTKSNNTLLFLKNNITKNKDDFIQDLIRLTPLLEDKWSSVFELMEKFIKFFSVNDNMEKFEERHQGKDNICFMDISANVIDDIDNRIGKIYLNLGAKILISGILKKNLLFLNSRMMISSAFNRNLTQDQNEHLRLMFSNLGLSENLYQTIKDSSESSISAIIGKYSQDYFSDILSEIVITMNDVYNSDIIKRKMKKASGYDYNPVKNPHGMSHNMLYRNMRNALITAHFFCYWSDMSSELNAEDYIYEINQILTENYYLPMYSKNSFDSFLILCTKLYQSNKINPIDVYYKLFDYIYSIFNNYNDLFLKNPEFENYNHLSTYELLVQPEDIDADILSYKDMNIKKCIHKIDDPAIQKEILKVIKKV